MSLSGLLLRPAGTPAVTWVPMVNGSLVIASTKVFVIASMKVFTYHSGTERQVIKSGPRYSAVSPPYTSISRSVERSMSLCTRHKSVSANAIGVGLVANQA